MFIQSRKEDASVKERERALQSLDLAYHMYKEITRNLDEGVKVIVIIKFLSHTALSIRSSVQFYNGLGAILTQFRETCKLWADQRQNEMQ